MGVPEVPFPQSANWLEPGVPSLSPVTVAAAIVLAPLVSRAPLYVTVYPLVAFVPTVSVWAVFALVGSVAATAFAPPPFVAQRRAQFVEVVIAIGGHRGGGQQQAKAQQGEEGTQDHGHYSLFWVWPVGQPVIPGDIV